MSHVARRRCPALSGWDVITSFGGVAVVVALVVAGGLLTWGHSFVNRSVPRSWPTRRTLRWPQCGRIPEHVAEHRQGEDRQLVDPNIHTDTRLRVHDQIAEILANVGCH